MGGMYPDNRTESVFGELVEWPGVDSETGKFTNGDFSDPTKKPSFVPAETLNLILDNLASLITSLGGEPNNLGGDQLRDAVGAALASTLERTEQMVLDAQLATNTWLPSVETLAVLQGTSAPDPGKNYLCMVLNDPNLDNNIVWRLAAGATTWERFGDMRSVPPATATERGGVRVQTGNGLAFGAGANVDRLQMNTAVANGAAGAMTGADKAKLDGVAQVPFWNAPFPTLLTHPPVGSIILAVPSENNLGGPSHSINDSAIGIGRPVPGLWRTWNAFITGSSIMVNFTPSPVAVPGSWICIGRPNISCVETPVGVSTASFLLRRVA